MVIYQFPYASSRTIESNYTDLDPLLEENLVNEMWQSLLTTSYCHVLLFKCKPMIGTVRSRGIFMILLS